MTGGWREWRGVAGATSVAGMAECGGNPRQPPVIPVKTGIHAFAPDHGAGIHASAPDRGAGMPVLPPSCPRILPPPCPRKREWRGVGGMAGVRREWRGWREWRGVGGNDGGNRVDSRFHGNDKGEMTSVAGMTGCGESYECGENGGVRRESPASPRHSPRHSRENGNPRVRPRSRSGNARPPPVMPAYPPPVIPPSFP